MKCQEAGENCATRISIICTLQQMLFPSSNQEDETRGAHSVRGGEEKCVQNLARKPERPGGR
jgi:hypothetical protein